MDSKLNTFLEPIVATATTLEEMKKMMSSFISGKGKLLKDASPAASISVEETD